jgi:hypothetical protein
MVRPDRPKVEAKTAHPDHAGNPGNSGLNPDFANIGNRPETAPIANIGSDEELSEQDGRLVEPPSQGAGRRIEVLGRGQYWQWRTGRGKGESRYAGKFSELSEARKRAYYSRTKRRPRKPKA